MNLTLIQEAPPALAVTVRIDPVPYPVKDIRLKCQAEICGNPILDPEQLAVFARDRSDGLLSRDEFNNPKYKNEWIQWEGSLSSVLLVKQLLRRDPKSLDEIRVGKLCTHTRAHFCFFPWIQWGTYI
jgi:hypothetical protein